jgi:hypothetical protein
MSIDDINKEARKAYAKRDKLETELRALNDQLTHLRSRYMAETRTWCIGDEVFRRETCATKVAS